MSATPEFDILLLGATGYTGAIVAEHITTHFLTDLKWAIAGRSSSSLDALSAKLKLLDPNRSPPTIIITGIEKQELQSLVKRTRVVINGIGPYQKYSEPVLAACATQGTHYVDFCTETPWIASLIPRYDALATQSGAIIIPSASLSSSPPDLLSWLLASKIHAKTGKPTKRITLKEEIVMKGMSGGSLTTLLSTIEHYGIGFLWSPNPYCMVPSPSPSPHAQKRNTSATRPWASKETPELGLLTTSLLSPSNTAIIHRSASLNPTLYSPSFIYQELAPAPNKPIAILTHILLKFVVLLLALPVFRNLIRRMCFEPGAGPDWRENAKTESAEFEGVGVGEGGERVRGRFGWKGALVHVSAVLATEAAGCLVEVSKRRDGGGKGGKDEGGMRTPSFLGMELVERARAVGCIVEAEVL
ncbi:Saccharopine dehydrogenase-domain-containing protein [Clohesyomyces aquaticus]|uniref:Saccharopine dehydrogenase-domain-containing protein n=1 Tax=Clohesyomyces aquaticus TaxID=1231657 RepID=A0A1Y1ZNI0_9PLEO|nr:Saccharopine dehydrogenase-domain-containing protein [Clohesyomyces aquaticus]